MYRNKIEANTEKPPFIPGKDINMFSQSKIGGFDEKATKDIELNDEDQEMYKDWNYTSKPAFFKEVVTFLKYEEKVGPTVISSYSATCCVISW